MHSRRGAAWQHLLKGKLATPLGTALVAWTAPHLLALSLVDIVGGCWGEALAGNWVSRAPLLLLRGLARPPTGTLWARAAAAQPQTDSYQSLQSVLQKRVAMKLPKPEPLHSPATCTATDAQPAVQCSL